MPEDIICLERQLSKLMSVEEGEVFVKENQGKTEFKYFFEYLNDFAAHNNICMSDIIKNSRINKNYVYNITNGITKRPSRDKILALCIGAKMTFDEVNRALYIGGKNRLDPRDPRDVWIAIEVNNRVGDVLKVNLLLEEKMLTPIEL